MPKSYLSNEPAAMRALDQKFDPFNQVYQRLDALKANGHAADKIELIVKGGTWSSYPWTYRQWFIRRCFDAANSFGYPRRRTQRTLIAAQRLNETARHRVIGMTLETRPDRVTPLEVNWLRLLGATRIELGVQTLEDDVLRRVKRGHDVEAVARATDLLKAAGFKVDYHLMPQLPGATPESDLKTVHATFDDPRFRPDMIKLYPCVVLERTPLYRDWRAGRYEPYSDAELFETLIAAKTAVPRYCRISRLIRDIPSTSVLAGNAITNLRQGLQTEMTRRGLACDCLRCREIGRAAQLDPKLAEAAPTLFDDRYEASHGTEHFLSFEDPNRRGVVAFCRLRLPGPRDPNDRDQNRHFNLMPEIRNAAFIRELHTYGVQVRIGGQDERSAQHKGLGKKLMREAERMARTAGFRKMAVISGIGVRGYYRKLGYRRRGTYMIKWL
jgi:elongator complex protein 3